MLAGGPLDSGYFVRRLRTAVLERIPALLSSDDFRSSVEREAHGQVLWRACMQMAEETRSICRTFGELSKER